MKILKKLKEQLANRALSKNQIHNLKGGDDKRPRPSGGIGTPPSTGGNG